MSKHIGNNGAVFAGLDEVGCITSWDWSQTQANVDTTCMKDEAATNLPGRTETTGNITVNWNDGDTGQAALVAGAQLTLQLYNDGETAGDLYDEVPVTIDTVSKSVADGSVITKTCAWTATGPLLEDEVAV
jgi:hypothetical protein